MGRGSSGLSGGGSSGGVNPNDVKGLSSLVSVREDGKKAEVDSTLKVMRDIENRYGINIEDLHIATITGRSSSAMAYYDNYGNLAVNESYFDIAAMNRAYDDCVAEEFHPKRGNKSGLEAVVAHEMGHRLNHLAANGDWNRLDSVANTIVRQAAKQAGFGNATKKMASSISGYATHNNAECIAEAFSDVYCNGSRASRASTAIVNVLNTYFGI